jgi:predicted transcriptional regulator
LWAGGSAAVGEVRQRLADKLAYATVLTVLRTLEEKGYVGHTGEGRAYRYRALMKRAAAGRTALRRLLDKLFQRSPALLLTQLVSDRGLDKQELRRLRGCWTSDSEMRSHHRRVGAVCAPRLVLGWSQPLALALLSEEAFRKVHPLFQVANPLFQLVEFAKA